MRLLSKIFATSASVVPNASAKPAMSANEGWLIASGWFGCDLMLKSCASGRTLASLEVPFDDRALSRRWRGFRCVRGALCGRCSSQ